MEVAGRERASAEFRLSAQRIEYADQQARRGGSSDRSPQNLYGSYVQTRIQNSGAFLYKSRFFVRNL